MPVKATGIRYAIASLKLQAKLAPPLGPSPIKRVFEIFPPLDDRLHLSFEILGFSFPMAKRKSSKPQTFAELAKRLGVTTEAIKKWRENFDDWPDRNDDGTFDLKKIRGFCKRHKLGPDNPQKNGQSSGHGLTEQRRLLLEKKNRTEAIRAEREHFEHQDLLGNIIYTEDVLAFFQQTIATVMTLHDQLYDRQDELLPEAPPSSDVWPEIRARALAVAKRIHTDVYDRMQELWRSTSERSHLETVDQETTRAASWGSGSRLKI